MLTVTREKDRKRRTIVVTFPCTPDSPNVIARAHWSVRKLSVDMWVRAMTATLDPGERQALRKNAQKRNPSMVTVRSIFLHRRKMFDPDNAIGALKFVIDGMVRAGLLDNDTSARIEFEAPMQYENCGPGMILCLTWTE